MNIGCFMISTILAFNPTVLRMLSKDAEGAQDLFWGLWNKNYTDNNNKTILAFLTVLTFTLMVQNYGE